MNMKDTFLLKWNLINKKKKTQIDKWEFYASSLGKKTHHMFCQLGMPPFMGSTT